MSAAVIAAVNCVADPKVVTRGEPLKFTTEVETSTVPFTVSVNAAPLKSVPLSREIVVTVGTGFGAALMLKFTAFDVPPPGVKFTTVTGGVPALATSPARIAAVNCVELTNRCNARSSIEVHGRACNEARSVHCQRQCA